MMKEAMTSTKMITTTLATSGDDDNEDFKYSSYHQKKKIAEVTRTAKTMRISESI